MLGLGNKEISKFEAAANRIEGLSGGFEVMSNRRRIIVDALLSATNSPDISRPYEAMLQAKADAREQQAAKQYREQIARIAAEAAETAKLEAQFAMPAVESKLSQEVTKLEAIPTLPSNMPIQDVPSYEEELQHHTADSARLLVNNAREQNNTGS